MTAFAGIGCRKGAAAEEIEAAVAVAVAGRVELAALATAETKRSEVGLVSAALHLGLSLIYVAPERLAEASARAITHSARVEAMLGLPSLAETAALAAAGPGSRLLGPRVAIGNVTCAIAVSE